MNKISRLERISERLIMSLVGKGEHFLIATTVSECFDFMSCAVEIEC